MEFLQLIFTVIAVVIIPLALLYAYSTANETNDKARQEINKTLSAKLSKLHTLTYDDVVSVYKSNLREHKIIKAKFGVADIIHDMQSAIAAEPLIDGSMRSDALVSLSQISVPKQEKRGLSGLLNPVYVFLKIANVVLFLLSFSSFLLRIELSYDYIVFLFHNDAQRITFYDIFHDFFNCWGTFFYQSGLFISIPCLLAWAILIAVYRNAHKQ